MSANKKSTSAYVPRAMQCKVCKDAGEPESVYSSHYVKDRNGNVACPKLKAIVCRNCNKRGHTSGYCKAPSEKEREERAKAMSEAVKKTNEAKASVSRFACLLDSDSEDDSDLLERKHARGKTTPAPAPRAPKCIEEPKAQFNDAVDFPKITTSTPAKQPATNAISYASMASKPVQVKLVKPSLSYTVENKIEYPPSPTSFPPIRILAKASELDWALMDSDSDNDYDDYEENTYY
jgi:hypothetical protein